MGWLTLYRIGRHLPQRLTGRDKRTSYLPAHHSQCPYRFNGYPVQDGSNGKLTRPHRLGAGGFPFVPDYLTLNDLWPFGVQDNYDLGWVWRVRLAFLL